MKDSKKIILDYRETAASAKAVGKNILRYLFDYVIPVKPKLARSSYTSTNISIKYIEGSDTFLIEYIPESLYKNWL